MSSKNEFNKLKKIIIEDGWVELRGRNGHRQFVHPTKPGKVTIPYSRGGITKNIQLSVLRQAGIRKNNTTQI